MTARLLAMTLIFACAKAAPPPEPDPKAASDTAAPTASEPAAPTEVERAEVREYMWALSNEVRALDEELDFGAASDGDRYAIQATLERILAITEDLQEENRSIRHPVLSGALPRFRSQVEYALAQARDESPSYVSAGKVIGSCATCHDVRACPFDSYSRCIEKKAP